MEFSNSQKKADELLTLFLNDVSSSNNIFLLKGSAGTGKSTLMSTILKREIYNEKSLAFCASTNKAVSILQSMAQGQYVNEDIAFLSIHKLLKIKRKIDGDGNETFETSIEKDEKKLIRTKAKSVYNYDIIIIDEASMISNEIISKIFKVKDKIKGKIIFMGDPAQLPPVNEGSSNIFTKIGIPKYELVEIMRCKGKLVKLCNKFRDLVFDRSTKLSFKSYKGENIRVFRNFNKWLDAYLEEYDEESEPIFLTYTNRKCDLINRKVREKLFDTREKYVANDKIIFNNYYVSKKEIVYYTSQTQNIVKCNIDIYLIKDFKKKCMECLKKLDKIEFIGKDIFIEDITNRINTIDEMLDNCMSHKIRTWNIDVSNDIIQVIHDTNLEAYDSMIELFKELMKKTRIYLSKRLKKFELDVKGSQIVNNIIQHIWEVFYNKYIDVFADISYGYCITTHKSQGSTFRNVYVDMENIIQNNSNTEESYRCLYTAISRSSKKSNILM